ncbi:MAG: hypothetical protein GX178_11060 [Acidobacteria bacterium]|jgi:hypothetical protein|nr:hypothetical protein [Thermoanaerobaculia bacterium]NLN12132.1 hypothetical protein [Acidobacteriota bacterium]OQC42053.1 MAG: hypothetical protein BWX64_00471 [Acidobacteria bacterium ADurb.Bin051]MBP7812547.1 hypothetical protein [Thermoanaerobaculia bacterium]MBP8844270.1 hypothetical protein [Thermoanaerobaculia bacterium]
MRRAVPFAALLLCLLLPGPVRSQSRLLGDAATLYQVHSVARAEVFPGFSAIPGDARILVLEASRLNGGSDFWLVPGTEGASTETVVHLAARDGGRGVLLAWHDDDAAMRDRLRLRGFDVAGWSELVELPLPWLAPGAPAPRFVVTADAVGALDAQDRFVTIPRDVIHCFWWGMPEGTLTLLYRAVFLVDGRAITLSAPFDLGSLDVETAALFPPAPALVMDSLALRGQSEASRVAVAFLGARSGRILSFDLQVLPDELMELADKARGHIIDLGATLYPEEVALLADSVGTDLLGMATSLHPAAAAHVAKGTRELIAAQDGSLPLPHLADKARGHIIDLVSTPLRGGVAREAPAERSALLEVRQPAEQEPGAGLVHAVKLRGVHAWVLPGTVSAPLFTRVASEANLVTVAWLSSPAELSYFELGLSADLLPRHLPLDRITLAEALALLEQRLANR